MDSPQLKGFKTLLRLQGRRLRVLPDAGVEFTALVQQAPPVVFESSLGADPRELVIIEALSPNADTDFGSFGSVPAFDGIVEVQDIKTESRLKVIRPDNNPVDFASRYWAQRVIEGKDS